jgi:hypothetical protein
VLLQLGGFLFRTVYNVGGEVVEIIIIIIATMKNENIQIDSVMLCVN